MWNLPALSIQLSSSWEASHLCKLWKTIDKRKGMAFASGAFTQRYVPESQTKISCTVGSWSDLWRQSGRIFTGLELFMENSLCSVKETSSGMERWVSGSQEKRQQNGDWGKTTCLCTAITLNLARASAGVPDHWEAEPETQTPLQTLVMAAQRGS